MSAPSSQSGGIQTDARLNHQRGLRWTAATLWMSIVCFVAAPEARALSFNDPPPNPFKIESWVLSDPENSSVTLLNPNDGANFASPSDNNDLTYTFTSRTTDQQPYAIAFDFEFVPDTEEGAFAKYQICGDATCSSVLGEGDLASFGSEDFDLASNQFLRFSITNTSVGLDGGGGQLTITNFSATPVPSPLPFAGLGLAALGIYRARRRKAATPK